MKKLIFIGPMLICFFCMRWHIAQASEMADSVQTVKKKKIAKYLELGISMNGYKGSLCPGYSTWDEGTNIGIRFNTPRWVNFHLMFTYGSITGQNPTYSFVKPDGTFATPNNYFRTSFFTLQADIQLNIIKKPRYGLFLFQGLGFMRFTPYDMYGNSLITQTSTRAPGEDYSNFSAIFPRGFGAYYTLESGYGIGITSEWLAPSTNYLDNISQWSTSNTKDNAWLICFKLYAPLQYQYSLKKKAAEVKPKH